MFMCEVETRNGLDNALGYRQARELSRKIDEEFPSQFHSMTFDEKVQFLENTTLQLKHYSFVTDIIDAFEDDANTVENAKKVVDTLVKNCQSTTILCIYESLNKGELMTIVDVLESTDRTWKTKPSRQAFLNAFEMCGLVRASNACPTYIKATYGLNAHMLVKEIMPLDFEDSGCDYDLYDDLAQAKSISEFITILKNSECNFHEMARPYGNFLCEDSIIDDINSEYYQEWTLAA